MSGPVQPQTPACNARGAARTGAIAVAAALAAVSALGALVLLSAPAATQTQRPGQRRADRREAHRRGRQHLDQPEREGRRKARRCRRCPRARRSRSSSRTSSTARAARSPSERKVTSLGSGFVVDGKEGLIVTNNHVIDGADEIIVNFNDGSKLKVEKVLGKDTKTDLALLKVTPKKPLRSVAVRLVRAAEGRRLGDGDRQSVRPRRLGLRRHHLGQAARHQHRPLRRLPADRRRHQQGQLRRPAVQHGRRGHRREHGHHLADRRLDRHRLRGAFRRGRRRDRSAAPVTARRAAAGSASRSSRSPRTWPKPTASRRTPARSCPASRRTALPPRPASWKAT